jgi:serine/threonine protein kinase
MLTEAEKRAATMAVSRFGADRASVQQAIAAALRAQKNGGNVSLFDILVSDNVLSPTQAQELRFSLDATQIDPSGAVGNAGDAAGQVQPTPASPERNGAGSRSGKVQLAADSEELSVIGDYRLLRRLGEGGMGAVYLGYNEKADRRVAIKVLPTQQAAIQSAVDRFYREAKSGALLNHPNIVRIIDRGQDGPTYKHYLVLEYVDGPSAQALLERFGRLSVGDAVHIVLDIAKALEHAHSRNVVHRDIKPANILLTQSGLAKLADLGLAKRTDETSHLTAARQGFGTPYYMPYEQAMNAKYADGRSDIYALGATLYHLVTGDVPFPGVNHLEIVDKKNAGTFAPARSLNDEVPFALDDILEKMLARDPRDRYQTASELIIDLERSGLSAQVPSFIDRDLAMLDPLVRQRLTAPAQQTAPDLQLHEQFHEASNLAETPPRFWYVRYHDRHGQLCKAKGSAEQIRRRLQEGRFPTQAQASQEPQGEYLPIGDFPEFRDVIDSRLAAQKLNGVSRDRDALADTVAEPAPANSKTWLMLAVVSVCTLVAVAALVLVLLAG